MPLLPNVHPPIGHIQPLASHVICVVVESAIEPRYDAAQPIEGGQLCDCLMQAPYSQGKTVDLSPLHQLSDINVYTRLTASHVALDIHPQLIPSFRHVCLVCCQLWRHWEQIQDLSYRWPSVTFHSLPMDLQSRYAKWMFWSRISRSMPPYVPVKILHNISKGKLPNQVGP